jgi:serine/threonine protein kinase
VVLYEMLTGELPFKAEGALATAMKHITDQPISPRERDPGVPEAMDALVMALLAKDPEERYPSAWEVAEDLRRARAGLPMAYVGGAAGHPETPQAQAGTDGGARSDDPGSESRSSRKRPMAIGLVALLALLALGTFGWGLTGYRDEGPNEGVGAVAVSEVGGEEGAPAAPEGAGDARGGASGEGVGSALPSVDLAGGRYVPASSSAPSSTSVSASASASPESASASPEVRASEPVASGPWTSAPTTSASPAASGGTSGSGGQDAGTTSPTVVESAAQDQYR